MTNRRRTALYVGKAGALIATALALAATSQVTDTEPVAYRAGPGCGPGGVVLLDSASSYDDRFVIKNAEALGLAGYVFGRGNPRGHWSVETNLCAPPGAPRDGGADAAPPDAKGEGEPVDGAGTGGDAQAPERSDGGLPSSQGSCPAENVITCRSSFEGPSRWFECTSPSGFSCRSTLESFP